MQRRISYTDYEKLLLRFTKTELAHIIENMTDLCDRQKLVEAFKRQSKFMDEVRAEGYRACFGCEEIIAKYNKMKL